MTSIKLAARFTLESGEIAGGPEIDDDGKRSGLLRRDSDKKVRLVEGRYPEYRRVIPAPDKCVTPAAARFTALSGDALAAHDAIFGPRHGRFL